MYIGQLVMSGQTAFTPWMERGGDSGRFTYEFISSGGTHPDPVSISVSDSVTI